MNDSLFAAGESITYQRYTNNEFVPARVLVPQHEVSSTFTLCMSATGMNKSVMHLWNVSPSPYDHLHPRMGLPPNGNEVVPIGGHRFFP